MGNSAYGKHSSSLKQLPFPGSPVFALNCGFRGAVVPVSEAHAYTPCSGLYEQKQRLMREQNI